MSVLFLESYIRAFHAINTDPNIELIVVSAGDTVVGVEQVIFTPHITNQGGWRATLEGVRTLHPSVVKV